MPETNGKAVDAYLAITIRRTYPLSVRPFSSRRKNGYCSNSWLEVVSKRHRLLFSLNWWYVIRRDTVQARASTARARRAGVADVNLIRCTVAVVQQYTYRSTVSHGMFPMQSLFE